MLFKRRKTSIPSTVRNAKGKRPIAESPVEQSDVTWIAGWATEFGIFYEDNVAEFVEWSECEHGSWDDATNTLTLSFIDPSREPMAFVLPREADPLIITMVRERVDRSIVYQQFVDLPSGAVARGQVRRNADESLFTQIIVDHDVTEADRVHLLDLENELREAVGL